MRWRPNAFFSRVKERINYSIFIKFISGFCGIMILELLLVQSSYSYKRLRLRDMQRWLTKAEHLAAIVHDEPMPAQEPFDAVWQPVAGTKFRFFVYSAYVERRTEKAVRVIGTTRVRVSDEVFCRLWLPDNRTITTRARVKTIRENWRLKYSAIFVLCLLKNTGVKVYDTVGAVVAVVASASSNRPPTNLLIVRDTKPKPEVEHRIHVCVKPFHFTYDRNSWMVEWIELNRLLGVTHFYMYNGTMSDGMNCILDFYVRKGIITLFPWKLPLISKLEIRVEGMFAAFNDCLYRSMANAGWLMVIDTDEVVIPKKEYTLTSFLRNMSAGYSYKELGEFLFRNAFFYVDWPDDLKAPVPLLTAKKTRRRKKVHALRIRNKYVVRPSNVIELGNHFAWERMPGAHSIGVRVEDGLSHHYRVKCESSANDCLNSPSKIDRTAHRWAKELNRKVLTRMIQINKSCRKPQKKPRKINLSQVRSFLSAVEMT